MKSSQSIQHIFCSILSLIVGIAASGLLLGTANAASPSFFVYMPLTTGGAGTSPLDTPTAPPIQAPPADVQRVIDLTNAYRALNGCQALKPVPELMEAAQLHSEDMSQNNYFSHTGLDGSEPWDRMLRAGYRWQSAGENLAAGQTSSEEVVSDWENSSGHRKNILNCGFQDIGVGQATNKDGIVYWTQLFGSR